MALRFVTGNPGKFAEIQAMIPDIEALDQDLVEIQELDAQAIVRAKLEQARQHHAGELLVEDTSLHLDALGGLPGPFIKWFLAQLGAGGLAQLIARLGDDRATARTVVGYAPEIGEVAIFEGTISGHIVMPRGDQGFGWDPIFQPDGAERTFAEMDRAQKQAVSMRRLAVEQFIAWRAADPDQP